MANYKRKMGIEEDKDSEAYYREKENRRINKPGKYDSIRPSGEEDRLNDQKVRGLKQAAAGTIMAPAGVALSTLAGSSRDGANKGPIGAGVDYLAGMPSRAIDAVKGAGEFIGSGVSQYKKAKDEEADLNRELDSQTKREARGMAKGGKVSSASSRADGIAQRGKTKGRMC
jgi:hypothetical protein